MPTDSDLPTKPLREWREKAALSQGELAKLAGVNLHSISDWELGNSEPQPKNKRALATALGILPEQIIFPATGKENPAAA